MPDIKTLRDAIPAKCFERSMVHSFSYVVRDLIIVGSLFYGATLLSHLDASMAVKVPLWALYGFVQGLFFTGLWILAHDCGHDSFSSNLRVNAVTGWFLHSFLLVPFFSWKFTHARHHRFHNHMERDTVFVPPRKSEVQAKPSWTKKLTDHHASDTPIVTIGALLFHQILGWPAYILVNAGAGVNSLTRSNRTKSPAHKQLHLNPNADVFTSGEAPLVAMSNLGIMITFAVLVLASRSLGGWNTVCLYGLPYLWMNHWIGEYRHPMPLRVELRLTFCSCHHLFAPHAPQGHALRSRPVDLRQGSCIYRRP
jgi:omega-6 fatty acid desaturase (delta-12 desaturase)